MKETITSIIITLLISFFLWKSISLLYSKFFKEKKQIHLKFFKNFLQASIIIIALYQVGIKFDTFKHFSETLLASSSLLVVVLGFAFQTSLEDFIAGILISIFKPFNIDDRVSLVGLNISGYIENITIRHTIIRTFNNSRLIIPNSIMNKEIIENTHTVSAVSSGFLDVLITYDSNIKKAKEIMEEVIKSHPSVVEKDKPLKIFVRDLADNGIALRVSVTTANIDQNFAACSDIREKIVEEFKKNNIKLAYPHLTIDNCQGK